VCAPRSFFQRSIRPSRSAADRAESTGDPDATRSGLMSRAPIASRWRGGADASRAIADCRSAGACAASTASTSGW
jgi:hypothetical protein